MFASAMSSLARGAADPLTEPLRHDQVVVGVA